jgi:hypothetical protein
MWENNVPSSKMKAWKKIVKRMKKNNIFWPRFGSCAPRLTSCAPGTRYLVILLSDLFFKPRSVEKSQEYSSKLAYIERPLANTLFI